MMIDNLFGKAYEVEGGVTLTFSPEVMLTVFAIASLAYVFYSIYSITMEDGAIFYYEKYIFPVMNFYLLGCCIGQSGYGCIFGVVDGTNDGSDKIKYTLYNIKDWHFAKYALIAGAVCILFIFVVQIFIAKNPAHFARDIAFMICLAVFGFCVARFAVTVNGFLLDLLFLPTSALAFCCQFMWPFGLILWILPTKTVAAMNRASEEMERKSAALSKSAPAEADEEESSATASAKFPYRVTDSNGESWYMVNDSGDHAEYECRKTGERTTVWYTGGYVNFPTGWNVY